ncbi:protodermal factor 1 [Iris pallida]|uniref:Protodermal factor 1 n=1 Tax=Iris pallida TaxID=29817 RepID=A0AAX6E6S0_IRIPA|nr:protodermal factor 1 [Iris pallida]
MACKQEILLVLGAMLVFSIQGGGAGGRQRGRGRVRVRFLRPVQGRKARTLRLPTIWSESVGGMLWHRRTRAYKEENTNWAGGYSMRFDGSPDLSRCYARVVGGPSGCGAAAGPAQVLKRMFTCSGQRCTRWTRCCPSRSSPWQCVAAHHQPRLLRGPFFPSVVADTRAAASCCRVSATCESASFC